MRAEVSFDLVMTDDMSFLEGAYRLPAGDWQVLIIRPDAAIREPLAKCTQWESGVTGLRIAWPASIALNERSALHALSVVLGVDEWEVVRGPDSIGLR